MSTTTPTPVTPVPVPFGKELVEANAQRAHTVESWGRAVIAEALARAAQLESFDSDGVSLTATVEIKPGSTVGRDPATDSGCIDFTIFGVHIHVDW